MFSVSMIVGLFFLVAFLAVIWWGINRIAIPEPIKTIVLVLIALIALYMLYEMVAGGGHGIVVH